MEPIICDECGRAIKAWESYAEYGWGSEVQRLCPECDGKEHPCEEESTP